MRTNIQRRSLVGALLALGVADRTFGQASAPASGASARPVAGPVAGRIVLGITIAETELVATGYRASKLLHNDVYNDKNEKIGKVDDIKDANANQTDYRYDGFDRLSRTIFPDPATGAPNPTDDPKRAAAVTVCAAAMPVALALPGTSRLIRAASTPSVAA